MEARTEGLRGMAGSWYGSKEIDSKAHASAIPRTRRHMQWSRSSACQIGMDVIPACIFRGEVQYIRMSKCLRKKYWTYID